VTTEQAFLLLGVMFVIGAAVLWWTLLRKPPDG
jgi:hypothetical protein